MSRVGEAGAGRVLLLDLILPLPGAKGNAAMSGSGRDSTYST